MNDRVSVARVTCVFFFFWPTLDGFVSFGTTSVVKRSGYRMINIGNEIGPTAQTSSSACDEQDLRRCFSFLQLDLSLFLALFAFLYSMSIFIFDCDLNPSIGAIPSENKSCMNNRPYSEAWSRTVIGIDFFNHSEKWQAVSKENYA